MASAQVETARLATTSRASSTRPPRPPTRRRSTSSRRRSSRVRPPRAVTPTASWSSPAAWATPARPCSTRCSRAEPGSRASRPSSVTRCDATHATSRCSSRRSRTARAAARRVAAVVVGSQIDVPVAGKYDLYAVYPMQREQATLGLVTRTFTLGGFFLVAARGRRRLGRDPAGRQPGAPGRDGRRAAVVGAAQRAHGLPGRGRPRPPRQVLQRDGRQPADPDPPARGSVAAAATFRQRRLARAAHAADDDPDGRRPHPRLPGRLRPGRLPLGRAAAPRAGPVRGAARRPARDQPVRRRRGERWTPR